MSQKFAKSILITGANRGLGLQFVKTLADRVDFLFAGCRKPAEAEVPSCFYRLGTGNEAKGTTNGVHTPVFNIDEDALEIGIGLMAWMAVNQLAD